MQEEKKLKEVGGGGQRRDEAVGLLQMQAVPAPPSQGSWSSGQIITIGNGNKGKSCL